MDALKRVAGYGLKLWRATDGLSHLTATERLEECIRVGTQRLMRLGCPLDDARNFALQQCL
jgi:hypothetical protein